MKSKAMLASAVGLVICSMYGCAPDPEPFNAAQLQRSTRKAAGSLTTRPMEDLSTAMDTTYIPARSGQPATRPSKEPTSGAPLTDDPILRISLQEVVHRAVNNNMDIRVAGYEPAINSNRVTEAEAKFDPTFFLNPSYEWKDAETAGVSTGFVFTDAQASDNYALSTGIRQDLESGASAELRYETGFTYAIPTNTETYPYYTSNLVAELKQPLLKDFGVEVNRARITVARNDQRISLLEFRKKLEDTLFSVEQTYWQLVQAEQEVKIQEKLLAATIETADLLAKRGTQDITRVQTSQANSAVQSRRAALIRARARVRDLSDQIKRLMADPDLPVSGNLLLLPATDTLKSPIKFDPQDQINQAIEHRFELAEQLLKIDSASLLTRVAKNNLLPTLTASTALSVNGVGQYWDASNTEAMEIGHVGYKIALQFEVPIGNRQAKAVYQRTLLQRQQAIDAYRNLIDQVALDVKVALRDVQTSWEEINANRQAVLANADALDAIKLREQNSEPLTYSFVQLKLDTQARMADAARAEAEAMSRYCVAIATLERAKGTLLRYDNVIMEEDRLTVLTRAKMMENLPQPIKPATAPAAGNGK